MSSTQQNFWKLRTFGRLSEARALFRQMESTNSLSQGAEKADFELMKISLLRSKSGGHTAAQDLKTLEEGGVFRGFENFQLAYQKAMNSFAEGLYPESLELLLAAERYPMEAWEELSLLTGRMLCLDNLAFPLRSTLTQIEERLRDPSLTEEQIALTKDVVRIVEAHEIFREGHIGDLPALFETRSWSQVESFGAWVASVPYVNLQTDIVQRAIERLTMDADFYLRNYRLQTLVGRLHDTSKTIQSSWKDRADRLYLWTWRWLADPTPARSEALTAVLQEFNAWTGADVLSVEDAALIRNALGWIFLFEPRFRSRWSALSRRVSNTEKQSPLFAFEALWIEWTKAALANDSAALEKAEEALRKHPLSSRTELAFRELLSKRTQASVADDGRLRVDPETGEILRGTQRLTISEPLAQLLALLCIRGRASFADVLKTCYQIEPYDPVIHDSKVQNLIMRARKILETDELVTKSRWIFLEAASQRILLETATARPRLVLPPKAENTSDSEESADAASSSLPARDRARNDRSLSVLLKEAAFLRGREITRLELEKTLNIPKATLNRYLRAWIERGWLTKTGSGRRVSYRITFFDS